MAVGVDTDAALMMLAGELGREEGWTPLRAMVPTWAAARRASDALEATTPAGRLAPLAAAGAACAAAAAMGQPGSPQQLGALAGQAGIGPH